jgi:hypothetical protein
VSRLESFIRRLSAQRDLLDHICIEVAGRAGPILEFGLGNGRTFDHLRDRLPGRRIVAFDRAVGAHSSCLPPEGDLVLGDIRETAGRFAGTDAVLVHADIGTGYDDLDAVTLTWLPGLVVSVLAIGGIVASGLPLDHVALAPLPMPPSVPRGRYFLYRRT